MPSSLTLIPDKGKGKGRGYNPLFKKEGAKSPQAKITLCSPSKSYYPFGARKLRKSITCTLPPAVRRLVIYVPFAKRSQAVSLEA